MAFAKHFDFLIPLSLQLNAVHIRYFNLWVLLDPLSKHELSKVYIIIGCKDTGIIKFEFVKQKLRSFHLNSVDSLYKQSLLRMIPYKKI